MKFEDFMKDDYEEVMKENAKNRAEAMLTGENLIVKKITDYNIKVDNKDDGRCGDVNCEVCS